MRLLLDTHVVLWWLADDETLTDETKDLIDTETEVFISAASVWEIAIKQASRDPQVLRSDVALREV